MSGCEGHYSEAPCSLQTEEREAAWIGSMDCLDLQRTSCLFLVRLSASLKAASFSLTNGDEGLIVRLFENPNMLMDEH